MAKTLQVDQRMFMCARQLVKAHWHLAGCSDLGALAFVRKDRFGSIDGRMQVMLAWDGTYNVACLGEACDSHWPELPKDGEAFARTMAERFAQTQAASSIFPEGEQADA